MVVKQVNVPELNAEGEVELKLANGYALLSGGVEFTAGEWVRLVAPDGEEVGYWDQQEWADDPALVMGAIINSAITAREDNA